MAPRIQYARTRDGVNIAFWSLGDGLPMVQVPPIPWSHVQKEWEDPGHRQWYEMHARSKRVVCYDPRGAGLSDRPATEPTVEDLLLDIDAVADKLGLREFAVAAVSPGAPVGLAYAARRPQRVSHLVLWCPYAGSMGDSPQWQMIGRMRGADWELFTETVAHAMVAGWAAGDEARRYAALMRAAVSPDSPLARMPRVYSTDDDADAVACPTLVILRAEASQFVSESARYLAASIPGANLAMIAGGSLLPWVGDMIEAVRAIDGFLGVGEALPVRPEPASVPAAGMVTVLFTDIEGSTTLTQRLGDAAAQEIVRAHNEIVRDAIRAGGGREIKHTGDGIMASFPLASSAIEAAVSIQREVAAHAPGDPAAQFRVRVGLNAGEPVAEDEDLFGTAVQLARRVCDAGAPGCIVVTDVVRQLAAGKGFLFADTGEVALKGFEDPVRLYTVSWSG